MSECLMVMKCLKRFPKCPTCRRRRQIAPWLLAELARVGWAPQRQSTDITAKSEEQGGRGA